MRIALTTTFIFALSVWVAYALSGIESKALDDTVRNSSWGEYVQLSNGWTHYELSGPKTGPVVVLVHGGTVPAFSWDHQIKALVNEGYQVLRYDQYGRGTSDRPLTTYNRELYLTQLVELLDKLQLEAPYHFIGISFGGATSTNFAAHYPDKVKTLSLLAPVFNYAEGRSLLSLANVPVFGEWYIRVLGVPKALSRGSHFLENQPTTWMDQFEQQMEYDGFERSLLSMARSDALSSYKTAYEKAANKPLLLIWGNQDKEIPRHHIDTIKAINKRTIYLELPGIGHNPNTAAANTVNQKIINFLNFHSQ